MYSFVFIILIFTGFLLATGNCSDIAWFRGYNNGWRYINRVKGTRWWCLFVLHVGSFWVKMAADSLKKTNFMKFKLYYLLLENIFNVNYRIQYFLKELEYEWCNMNDVVCNSIIISNRETYIRNFARLKLWKMCL